MTRKPTAPDWLSTPNARRKRPMVMITISPEGLVLLDKLRGGKARGAFIEDLIGTEDRAVKRLEAEHFRLVQETEPAWRETRKRRRTK